MSSRNLWAWAASLSLLSLAAVAWTARYGPSRRAFGPEAIPFSAPLRTALVERREEAYRLWRAGGFRGRRLVAAVGRWPRVTVNSLGALGVISPYPVAIRSPLAVSEPQVNGINFLYMAALSGVARTITCVLPAAEYERSHGEALSQDLLHKASVVSSYQGYRRVFCALEGLPRQGEPVLLYIGASFLTEERAENLARAFAAQGLTCDLAVLCLEADDEGATDATRADLKRLEAALRMGRGP